MREISIMRCVCLTLLMLHSGHFSRAENLIRVTLEYPPQRDSAALASVAMFWNVENFFDSQDDPLTSDDDYTSYGTLRWGRKRFDRKRNAIVKTILSVRDSYGDYPVVVGLAEVENFNVLWRLLNLTPLAKLGYSIIHRDSPDRRGIDVAMLYRSAMFTPLKTDFYEVRLPYGPEAHSSAPAEASAGASLGLDTASNIDSSFRTRLILSCIGVLRGRDTVQFCVVHFPSKYGGAAESQPARVAAAKVLLAAASRPSSGLLESSASNVSSGLHGSLVSEDSSDFPSGAMFSDIADSTACATTHCANRLVVAMGDFNEQRATLEPLMVPFEPCVALNGEGSIKFHGEWETIDHFFVLRDSAGISRRGMRPGWRLSSYLFDAPFLLEPDRTYLGVKPFRTFIGPKYNGGVSDHLPIVLLMER